jgi:hypothetical protein
MARLIVDGADLVVGLSWLEKLGAVHGNVRVPLRAVRSAVAEPAASPTRWPPASPNSARPAPSRLPFRAGWPRS